MSRIILHGSFHNRNFGDLLLFITHYDWVRGMDIQLPIYVSNGGEHVVELRPGVRPLGLLKLIMEIRKDDVFVYCGGGYFGERPHKRLRWQIKMFIRHLLPGWVASLKGARVLVLGVGMGQFHLDF